MKSAFVILVASALLMIPTYQATAGLTKIQTQLVARNDTSVPASRSATTDRAVGPELKRLCYMKHANLMDKPAVRTVERCWAAHGHLMG
jgi:hypothetical protein